MPVEPDTCVESTCSVVVNVPKEQDQPAEPKKDVLRTSVSLSFRVLTALSEADPENELKATEVISGVARSTDPKLSVLRQHSHPLTRKELVLVANALPLNRSSLLAMYWRKLRVFRRLTARSSGYETFCCLICLENKDIRHQFAFSAHGGCDHMFCKACLRKYVSVRTSEAKTRHPCPAVGDSGCRVEATIEDLQQLLDEEAFRQHERFSKMNEDANHRDCPSCGHIMLGDSRSPVITCEKCSVSFCFYHSNAHTGISCLEYARRLRADVESETTIKRIAKKCPNCKIPVEKNGVSTGCDHVTCLSCNTHWCWVCGRRRDVAHFQVPGCPYGLDGNSNNLDDPHNMEERPWFERIILVCLVVVLFVLSYFILLVPAMPLALISWCKETRELRPRTATDFADFFFTDYLCECSFNLVFALGFCVFAVGRVLWVLVTAALSLLCLPVTLCQSCVRRPTGPQVLVE